MRRIIILLAVAVVLKLAVNEWNYRAATEEALIAAYSARASETCRTDARTRGFPPAQASSRAGDMRVAIGANDLDVWLWDVGNSSWVKRYRTPYMHLTLQAGEATLRCQFDLVKSTAVVTR